MTESMITLDVWAIAQAMSGTTKYGFRSRVTGPADARRPAPSPSIAAPHHRAGRRSGAPAPGPARRSVRTRPGHPAPCRVGRRCVRARRPPFRNSCERHRRSTSFGLPGRALGGMPSDLGVGGDAPKDAIDELARVRTAEGLCQLDRFVDGRLERDAGQVANLETRDSQQGALHLRHLVETPVTRSLRQVGIDLGLMVADS